MKSAIGPYVTRQACRQPHPQSLNPDRPRLCGATPQGITRSKHDSASIWVARVLRLGAKVICHPRPRPRPRLPRSWPHHARARGQPGPSQVVGGTSLCLVFPAALSSHLCSISASPLPSVVLAEDVSVRRLLFLLPIIDEMACNVPWLASHPWDGRMIGGAMPIEHTSLRASSIRRWLFSP